MTRTLEQIGQRLDELADELGVDELVGLAEDLASYTDDLGEESSFRIDGSSIVANSVFLGGTNLASFPATNIYSNLRVTP